jgi:hypothetical protein
MSSIFVLVLSEICLRLIPKLRAFNIIWTSPAIFSMVRNPEPQHSGDYSTPAASIADKEFSKVNAPPRLGVGRRARFFRRGAFRRVGALAAALAAFQFTFGAFQCRFVAFAFILAAFQLTFGSHGAQFVPRFLSRRFTAFALRFAFTFDILEFCDQTTLNIHMSTHNSAAVASIVFI